MLSNHSNFTSEKMVAMMMNMTVQIALCLIAWTIVLIRAKNIHWHEALKGNRITLKVWLIMLFFAIGLIGLLDFAFILDIYTFNNFSRFVTHISFLVVITLSVTVAHDAVGRPADNPLIIRLWLLLIITVLVLGFIYVTFLSQMPQFSYYKAPQSFHEMIFKLIDYSFKLIADIFLIKILIKYLPTETSLIMRIRVLTILIGNFIAGVHWAILIIVVGAYFWPDLASPMLINFGIALLPCVIILHFIAFLNNNIYLKFILFSKRIQHWYAFQDLQCLIERMKSLFPVIGLPPGKPNFIQFVRDPERYLYPAIILILDGRAMLEDFLAEIGDVPPPPQPWEIAEGTDLVGEALEVQWALQFVQPPDDFYAMVEAYRRASRELLKSPRKGLRTQDVG